MRRPSCFVAFGLAFLFALNSEASVRIVPDGSPYLADRVVIKFNPEVPQPSLKKTSDGKLTCNLQSFNPLIEPFGIVSIEPFYKGKLKKEPLKRLMSRLFIVCLDNPGALEILPHLQGLPELEFAEPYFVQTPLYTPNDPDIWRQWYLGKIRCFEAWDIIRGDTTKIAKVGIVDTGVNWYHPELEPNVWINRPEDINRNGRFDNYPQYYGGDLNYQDDDGNGYIDDVVGFDVYEMDPNPDEEGSSYHGSFVAACASQATDNHVGGAGVGFSGRIICVRAGDQYYIYSGYQGITYCADNDADVINCSWGNHTYSYSEQQIITTAYQSGSLIVAAAGAYSWSQPVYPAAYEHVMAVTSTDQDDHKAYFADYGNWIDICAPGVDIYLLGRYFSGTSFSSPIVAGVALLAKTQNPQFGPDSLEYRLKITATNIDSLNPGYQGLLGAGRVDAYLALFPFEITLVPEESLIVIPPEGGSFRFLGRVHNPIELPRTFDAWSVVIPPRPDTAIGPLRLLEQQPVPASDSIGRSFREYVPGWAPAGTYTYIGYVGDYPLTKLDSSYFSFEKLESLLPSEQAEIVKSLPEEFSLLQNRPNPFNVSTTISYQLPERAFVKLEVLNLLGREAATLVNREEQAGHKVTWDATAMPSGIYFYRLSAGQLSETKMMILLK